MDQDIRDYRYVECRIAHDWDKRHAPITKTRPGNVLEWRCTGPCKGTRRETRSRATGELIVGSRTYDMPEDYKISGYTKNDFYKEFMRRENGGKWGRNNGR